MAKDQPETDEQVRTVPAESYRLPPGKTVHLDRWSTSDRTHFPGKKAEAQVTLAALNDQLSELQQLLYAESRHKVLVVLQGMDTSGKDGTIRHVFRTVNPQGVKVKSFKRPNDTELAHDYLWRVHEHTPGDGRLTIFNRSHYEDVLVPFAHRTLPRKVLDRRYGHIADFERMLADEGTIIRKFFLHISRDEQEARLRSRLDDPAKHWKFEVGDVNERRLWDEYQRAYERLLARTSTDQAPWYIVPSDRKWYRNLVVSSVLIDTLRGLKMSYPAPSIDVTQVVID
jgi:PPK2 family polyphosphate:nucleotide phosphotransferase